MIDDPNSKQPGGTPDKPILAYEDRLRGPLFGGAESAMFGRPIAAGARLIRIGDPARVLNLLNDERMDSFKSEERAVALLMRSHAYSQLGNETASAAERHRVHPQDFSDRPRVRCLYYRASADASRRAALLTRASHPDWASMRALAATRRYARAQEEAMAGNEMRLAMRCALAQIYSKGLIARVSGASKQTNVELLMSAVQCAAILLEATPRGEPRSLFAASTVADLARPLGLNPTDVSEVCGTGANAAACAKLLGTYPAQSWASFLLREVEHTARYGVLDRAMSVARALVLAGAFVLKTKHLVEARQAQTMMLTLETAHRAYREARARVGRHVPFLPGLADAMDTLRRLTGQPNSIRVFG